MAPIRNLFLMRPSLHQKFLAVAVPALVALASDSPAAAPAPIIAALPPGVSFDDTPLPEHAEDVADYTLVAKLDPAAHTLHGEGTIRWRNASTVPVKELWVHLYLNAFKNQESVFLREPVGFRSGAQLHEWGYIDVRKLALRDANGGAVDLWPDAELRRPNDTDETDARVPLPREIAPGETITLDVAFDDRLPSVIARTGHAGSFHMVAQWFPKLARLEPDGTWSHFPFHKLCEFYADFGTYDVTLDVPEAFVVGATGPAIESRVEGGRRIERHLQSDIHDFAWTAWDKFQQQSETIDGVAVTVLHPPGYNVMGQRELAAMRFALPYFGARYGRYPYKTLTLVHPPETAREAGGMEYPTLITTGGHWYDPKGERLVEHVTIHEFGHQYFYGLVATNEVTWPFLDEGINEYATEQSLAAWLGQGSLFDIGGLSINFNAASAAFSNRAVHNEPVAQPAFAFTTGGDYGTLVYGRTAAIVETFRRVYGDAAVTRALGRYARRQRFRHPVPEDLLAAFTESLGIEPTATLRTALFAKGWVDYVVGAISSERVGEKAGIFDRNGKRDTVATIAGMGSTYEGWVLVMRRGTLTFPVDVELVFADGTTERRRWDGVGESTRMTYRGSVALRGAVIDPDHAVLLDDTFSNNHATARNQSGGGAPRTVERATYWAQLLLQAVTP